MCTRDLDICWPEFGILKTVRLEGPQLWLLLWPPLESVPEEALPLLNLAEVTPSFMAAAITKVSLLKLQP